jgi:hypothetical protein
MSCEMSKKTTLKRDTPKIPLKAVQQAKVRKYRQCISALM